MSLTNMKNDYTDQDIQKIWWNIVSEFRKRNILQKFFWIMYAIWILNGVFFSNDYRSFLGLALITHPLFYFIDWLLKSRD